MEFTWTFIRLFWTMTFYIGPLLLFFLILISSIGQFVGRIEKWSFGEAQYFAFITATTVGFGDYRPSKRISRLASVVIAMIGLIMTGLIVTIAIKSADLAFDQHFDQEEVRLQLKINGNQDP